MEETRRNVLVGVFVLVGLSALAALIVLFGRGPTWLVRGGSYPIHVRFDEVSGIRPGTLVTAKGITIGRVDRVALQRPAEAPMPPPEVPPSPDGAEFLIGREVGVDVVLAIEREYRLPMGSTARTTEPVLGQGRPPIEIMPGPVGADPLPAGASIDGTVRKAIDTIFPPGVVTTFQTAARQIGDAAEALTPVLAELEGLIEARSPSDVDRPGGPEGNLASALTRLDASLKHFNDVLGDADVKSQVRESVASIHEMSEKGKQVMADLEVAASQAREVMTDVRQFIAKADTTLENVDSSVHDLSQATLANLDKVDRLLDHLSTVARQVSEGEGNIGQLIMDNRLYESMVLTAERLSLAVEEFRALIAEWREGKIRVSL